MTILGYILELLHAYLSLGFMKYWFFPLIALAFVATVPVIVRVIFLRR